MTFIYADRVKETTTTTGTGPVTLAGAVAGFRAFSAAMANGDTCDYCIQAQTPGEWETGTGTWNTGGTLTRTTVRASSNANSAVSFSAGAKDVFITPTAYRVSAKADTASLATVATTGAYSDLSGKPTLGTSAPLNVPASGDAAGGEVVKGSDSRLTDTRTPSSTLAHASTHASGGSDPVTLAESQVTNLVTDLGAKLVKASNLSDLASAGTARTNLGLGTAATQASTAFAAASHTHAEADVTGLVTDLAAKLAAASNLSDLANAATARTNLGIGQGVGVTPSTQRWARPISSTIASTTFVNGTVYYVPIFLPLAGTIDALSIQASGTPGGTGSVLRYGIYASAGGNLPGSLVVDAGTVAATSTGFKTIVLGSPQALAAGLYFIAFVQQGNPTPVATVTRVVTFHGLVSTSTIDDNQNNGYADGNAQSGALPGTAGGGGFTMLSTIPGMQWRFL